MSLRVMLVAVAGLLAVAPRAHAQETSFVRWHLMGGINEPVGNTNDLLQTGWNLGFGVTFRQPGEPFGIRLEFNYGSNNASSKLINQGGVATGLQVNGGWMDSWSGTVNLEAQHLFSNAMYGYLIGGVGFYYTSVQLTEQGYGYVCNPWWYYCYPGVGNVVVASNSNTRFGWNAGGGLAFRLRAGPTLLVEARYTQIQTSGQSIEMVPITVGLRF
jgi:opacity protein-like surface antigen